MIFKLFAAFIQVGISAFGGGLSTLPLIEYQLVTKNGWMGADEFNQMLAVSQVTPGPIAINAATYAGYKEAGFFGSLFSTLGVVAAPILALCVVLLVLKRVSPESSGKFKTMLRPVVAGLLTLSIVTPLVSTWKNGPAAAVLFVLGVLLLKKAAFFKNRPAVMLILFGLFGAVFLR